MTLREHLLSRFFNPAVYEGCTVDEEARIMTCYLWNLSGQLVGYQQYRPDASKDRQEDPRLMRYFTWVSRYGTGPQLAFWGLETLVDRREPVYLCEGIFDACRFHWYGLQAIAVLANDPQHLKEQLWLLGYKYVSCVQGDVASRKLVKYSTLDPVYLPEGEDVGSLSKADFYRTFMIERN